MEIAKERRQSFQASTTLHISGSASMQRREVPSVLQSDFRKVLSLCRKDYKYCVEFIQTTL